MRIKKLSILGFKSFMNRLVISFPNGISGFVGPNGCGKSNIVDAIRWCMGEQSAKQLRGRQMEDVIFAGAGEYKPLGMAEVSIVFEEGQGYFPPEFGDATEVMVTRRLYRSGESEYRINNTPCRLKDIYEIFMDTGLGNKAYSIIGQGQIGAILEQRPEDTRMMLEEAAGITKYRKKAQVSQKKMDLAENNLQRVEDILGEIERQMKSLKRQAGKAKRYKKLGDEIRDLELTLLSNNYDQLREDSESRAGTTEDLRREEIAKSTELAELEARIENMNRELEEKDTVLHDLRNNHIRLRERVQKKEAAIESLEGGLGMLNERMAKLKEEQEQIEQRLFKLKEERTQIEQKLEKVKEKSGYCQGEIRLAEDRVRDKREFLKRIKEEYEDIRTRASDRLNKEVGLDHESNYIRKMIEQITDRHARLKEEQARTQERTDKVIRASERKNRAREAAAQKLKEIEAAIEQENAKVQELEKDRKDTEMKLKSEEADLNSCESRLSSLRTLAESFEGYKRGVRTIMKAQDLPLRQQGRVLGLVADFLEVDPKYELAVEAVLADQLQYIVVESQKDGKEAVEYLKNQAKGRSSFVPLKGLNGNGSNRKDSLSFPFLRDMVSVPDVYRPVVNALLGNTMVAENLEQAISAWEGSGKEQCFVTPEGDMVDQRGVITGGRSGNTSTGLLARKREITLLKEEVSSRRTQVENLRGQLEKILSEIKKKKDSLEAFKDNKWSCQGEINQLDNSLFRLGEELDQLEKYSQKISEDLSRKGKEEEKHKQELKSISERLNQCREKRLEEEEYFKKKELELQECQDELEQAKEKLSKLRGDQRIFEEEGRSFTREMERLDSYVNDSRDRLNSIQKEMEDAGEKYEECLHRKEEHKESLENIVEETQLAEEALNRADTERQTFQNEIRDQEARAKDMREKIDSIRERLSRREMEDSEIKIKITSLEEKAKEDFNVSLADIYKDYIDEDFSAREVKENLDHKKAQREKLGEVNLTAIREHEALKERFDFYASQRRDLIDSIKALKRAIVKINKTSLERFTQTLQEVDAKLKEVFSILFNGGSAGLRLTDEKRPLDSGILVEVRPPGKKLSYMGLLSGGEKALVAMALLFAIYMIRPSPFCLLDEVDAPLDEANIDRFNELLREIRKSSQIIMVTHNRRSMEIADRLFGVTMETRGISKLVAVDLEKIKDDPYGEHSEYYKETGTV